MLDKLLIGICDILIVGFLTAVGLTGLVAEGNQQYDQTITVSEPVPYSVAVSNSDYRITSLDNGMFVIYDGLDLLVKAYPLTLREQNKLNSDDFRAYLVDESSANGNTVSVYQLPNANCVVIRMGDSNIGTMMEFSGTIENVYHILDSITIHRQYTQTPTP